ncbi:MAG: hypothetical protein FJW35_05660 [Acidobacteria bacterium]|nr:hypothetical protein [Acidobacteriota bacterium]
MKSDRLALAFVTALTAALGAAGLAGAAPCQDRATNPPPTQGRALVVEDYCRIQTVDNPQISPDGRWVAFRVSTRMEQDNSTRAETYLVPADGSAVPRRIVH